VHLISRLRREQRGMTLIEALAAMSIGMIVALATFGLIEAVMKRTGEVSSRVETTQRARQAMDNITRDLRSQVCVMRSDGSPTMSSARSVYVAGPNSITFFGDTADESWKTGTTAMPVATLRTIALSGNTIAETVTTGTVSPASPGTVSYANATGTTRTELSDAIPVKDGGADTPLFTYYAYEDPTTLPAGVPPRPTVRLNPVNGSLSEADVSRIARIVITFRVLPAGRTTLRGSTVISDEVTVRTVDPNSANPRPTCI
jgi:type II secretory pathway pseudopilin PulG